MSKPQPIPSFADHFPKFSPTEQTYLDAMLSTRLWGDSFDEVVVQLVRAGIRKAITDGLIKQQRAED